MNKDLIDILDSGLADYMDFKELKKLEQYELKQLNALYHAARKVMFNCNLDSKVCSCCPFRDINITKDVPIVCKRYLSERAEDWYADDKAVDDPCRNTESE